MSEPPLEVEVKLAIDDPDEMRSRLLRVGAVPRTERLFEDNVLYDTEGRKLGAEGKLLRLRRSGDRAWITFKAPSDSVPDAAMKVLVERECELPGAGAIATMGAILQGLGLVPVYRYQKYREELALQGIHVTLDETPIGCFMELEGDAAKIREVTSVLGRSADEFIKESYRALHQRWCAERGVPMEDMVFAH